MLASVGGAVAVLLVVVVLLVVLGGDDGERVAAGSTTTSSSSTSTSSTTETTVELTPVTTAPPTTAPPTTAAPPPTTAAPQPVVGGSGAILTKPAASEVRTSSGACESLATPGPGWTVTCGAVTAKGGSELVWLLERRSSGDGTRTYVLRRTGPASWTVVLSALDPGGTRFSDVKVAVADVSGDGAQEIGFGFHVSGSGQILAVDLVEGPGVVAVHRDLPKGSARISSGQLNTWTPDTADPSAVIKQIIRFTGGAWRITSSAKEPGPAPASQL